MIKIESYQICICNCCGRRFWHTEEELCFICYESMCPDCHVDYHGVCCGK